MAQKARREVEVKAKEEAKKQRIAEKKKKLKYIQQLQDKILEEEATLLEGAEGSQVMGYKCKKQFSKKARGKQLGKYHRGTAVKMGSANLCERCVYARQDCLIHFLR